MFIKLHSIIYRNVFAVCSWTQSTPLLIGLNQQSFMLLPNRHSGWGLAGKLISAPVVCAGMAWERGVGAGASVPGLTVHSPGQQSGIDSWCLFRWVSLGGTLDALLMHWLVYKSEHLGKQCSKRKWKLPVRLGPSLEKCIAPLLLLVRQPQSSDFKVREDGPQALDGGEGCQRVWSHVFKLL